MKEKSLKINIQTPRFVTSMPQVRHRFAEGKPYKTLIWRKKGMVIKMIKAVFLDYTGTLMQEESEYAMQMAMMIAQNSSIKDMKTVFGTWWTIIKELESKSYLKSYKTEDEILCEAVKILQAEYGLKARLEDMRTLAHKFWSKAPAFDDVKPFFTQCKYPIYIITNNGIEYVSVFLEDNRLQCAGIICGDMVKAYKPHKELFEKALQVSGCSADEVIHIGDSVSSDVMGALSVGIKPYLLNRKKEPVTGSFDVISSLLEALELVEKYNTKEKLKG